MGAAAVVEFLVNGVPASVSTDPGERLSSVLRDLPGKTDPGPVPSKLTETVIRPLLEAAQRCVEQGVVADADLADAGIIFGTGFAPHTGGPMNYLKSIAPYRIGHGYAIPGEFVVARGERP